MRSSSEQEVRLYVPGRSTTRTTRSPSSRGDLYRPVRGSLVLPGQLATCCETPVNALKTADLPTFGWPTSATVTVSGWRSAVRSSGASFMAAFGPDDQHLARLARAQRHPRIT